MQVLKQSGNRDVTLVRPVPLTPVAALQAANKGLSAADALPVIFVNALLVSRQASTNMMLSSESRPLRPIVLAVRQQLQASA